MKKFVKPLILLLFLVAIVVLGRLLGFSDMLVQVRDWVAAQGAWAPVLYAGVYALATLLAIPGSALTITAGALFGSLIGVVTVIIGATIGASLCFLVARYLARDAVKGMLEKNEKFRKLDEMTEKNGSVFVAITRLVPLFPFNVLNYGFGLTGVRFVDYVLWSFLCMLPGTVLYVVGTDAVTTALEEGRVPWLLIGVVVTVAALLTVLVARLRKKIKE
jgi:uncharacterized membrane protein YdjX (TVP38/TMEM64 family)